MSIKNVGKKSDEVSNISTLYDAHGSTLLNQNQAAEFLRLSKYALQTWRSTGRYNLPYVKSGGKVFYKLEDLRNFLESRKRTHT